MRKVQVQAALSFVLTSIMALGLSACGRDKANNTDGSKKPNGGDATAEHVKVDGKEVPFAAIGEVVSYEGDLAKTDDSFQFSTARAYKVEATTVFHLTNAESSSPDCKNPDDFMGPSYMLLKITKDGYEIVKSTDQIEMEGGKTVSPTPLADFPGSVDAGTYTVVADFLSLAKSCHVKGSFTLAQ